MEFLSTYKEILWKLFVQCYRMHSCYMQEILLVYVFFKHFFE